MIMIRKLKKYVTHNLHEVPSLAHGERVMIGGKIVDVQTICLEEEVSVSYITLDDGLETCAIYIAEEPYSVFKDLCEIGREVLVKGRVSIIKHAIEAPTIRVLCSSMAEVPDSGENTATASVRRGSTSANKRSKDQAS